MTRNDEKRNVEDFLVENPVDRVTEELAVREYGVDLESVYRRRGQRTQKYEPWSSNKSYMKSIKERAFKNTPKVADRINRKIKREINKHYGDDDAMRLLSEELHRAMPETYRLSGKTLKADFRVLDMAAKGATGLNSALIHNNIRMKKETWIQMLTVDIDISDKSIAQVRQARHEMDKMTRQSALVMKRTKSGAPILQKDIIDYRDKIKKAVKNQEDWHKGIKDSNVAGDLPVTFNKSKYDLRDARDYDSVSKYKESIDKQTDKDYWEWRISIVMENYIAAAQETFGAVSSEATEISRLVRQFKPHDFEKFASSFSRGKIIYVYENGMQDFNGIISDLHTALKQANG